MAKVGGIYTPKKSIKRKGIHSKNNSSTNKRSKTYLKRYRGQGR